MRLISGENRYTREARDRAFCPTYPAVTLIMLLAVAICTSSGFAGDADLDRAFRELSTYSWSKSREPLEVIERAIETSEEDPVSRKALEKRLATVLRSPAPFPAKQYACRKLSQIGTADSVPILAAALLDPALSHSARFVLERIPNPTARQALREAASKAEYDAKIGIINSLGVLRDAAAVELLANIMRRSPSSPRGLAEASAAVEALGHIGTTEAAERLAEFRTVAQRSELRSTLNEALIRAAERLATEGHRTKASAIYTQLHTTEEPDSVRSAAFRGLLLTQPDQRFDYLLRALKGADDKECGFTARILADEPWAPGLDKLLQMDYPPAGQIALLEAIRNRPAPAGRGFALRMLKSSDSATRVAALWSLAAVGRAEDVPTIALFAAGEGEDRPAAAAALASLPDPEANQAIISSLENGPPSVAVDLIQALARRGATEAGPALAVRLNDPSKEIRVTSLRALAEIGGAAQAQVIAETLKASTSDEEREAAQSTLISIANRSGEASADGVIRALAGADSVSGAILLQVLGVAGGSAALGTVRSVLDDGKPEIRETAFRVMTDWTTADAAPDLLRLSASSTNGNWRTLAFRGYVRLASESELAADSRIRMLREAMASARNPEERKLVIAAIGEQDHPAALSMLTPHLEEPALAQEACAAAVSIAVRTEPARRKEMVPLLKQVLKVSKTPTLKEKVEAILRDPADAN